MVLGENRWKKACSNTKRKKTVFLILKRRDSKSRVEETFFLVFLPAPIDVGSVDVCFLFNVFFFVVILSAAATAAASRIAVEHD